MVLLFRPLATPAGVLLFAALMAGRHDEVVVEGRSPAFFRKTTARQHSSSVFASSATDERSLSVSRIGAVPRGGAEEESSDKMEEETEAETEILYLPGLLDVDLISVDQVSCFSRVN